MIGFCCLGYYHKVSGAGWRGFGVLVFCKVDVSLMALRYPRGFFYYIILFVLFFFFRRFSMLWDRGFVCVCEERVRGGVGEGGMRWKGAGGKGLARGASWRDEGGREEGTEDDGFPIFS